ncbi:MAG: RHS repeat protein, partial [Deltaproteobacteria bacterium]|nr:RHS repeat protein [Deltaproteobacteria bacterium]
MPGYSTENLLLPSSDGTEVYEFDPQGRHLRTVDSLTLVEKWRFEYDLEGHLSAIEDTFHERTTIEWDGAGHPSAIVGPYGHRTSLTVDADGYIATVTNPEGETHAISYWPGGLMQTFTDPKGNVHRYEYDPLGRLTRAEDPAGGSWDLQGYGGSGFREIAMTSALGRTTYFQTLSYPDGTRVQSTTQPSGAATVRQVDAAGSATVFLPDGTRVSSRIAEDPRFGMRSPFVASTELTLPSGLTQRTTRSRVVLAGQAGLERFIERLSINGREYATTYEAATRQVTTTSPLGRQTTVTLNADGQPIESLVPDVLPMSFAHDTVGRLDLATQGARTTDYEYDSGGRLQTVTDPLGRVVGLSYDAADRVLTQTRPDGEVTSFSYDNNGNLSSLSPPGRPAHLF